MVDVLEPADAETVVIGFLAGLMGQQEGFEAVAVRGRLPVTSRDYEPPPEVIEVRQTGGVERDLSVTIPQVTLTSWAATPEEEIRAGAIGRRAHALMRAAELLGRMGSTGCSSVDAFALPYNDPDPTTGRARYSATYGVSLRGQVVRA